MIDFGMAIEYEEDAEFFLTELCGSPHYLAPEVLGQAYRNECDMWSMGVMM